MKGLPGSMGSEGPTGTPGTPGRPGNCLDKSELKNTAFPMVHCLEGPIGPPGRRGEMGLPGLPGIRGLKGEKGEVGIEGPQGARGNSGPAGKPGSIRGLSCNTRFGVWINASEWDAALQGIQCNSSEFLQGFKTEFQNPNKRYRYTCCSFK